MTSTDPIVQQAEMQQTIVGRLDAFGKQVLFRLTLEGVAWTLGACVALATLFLGLDWWLELSPPARRVLLAAGFAIVAWQFWQRIWKPIRDRRSPIDLAAILDRVSGAGADAAIAPRVATLVELPGRHHDPDGTSVAMVQAAVRENYRRLEGIRFSDRLSQRHLRRSVLITAGEILIVIIVMLVMPHSTSLWVKRWFLGSNVPWPRSTTFEVVGLTGNRVIVPRGEPASLQVSVHDKKSPTETVWMRLAPTEGRPRTVSLTRKQEGDFRFEIPPLKAPLQARLRGGDGRFGPFAINPVDRPRVTGIHLSHQHPRDQEVQTAKLEETGGEIALLSGTDVDMLITANVAVRELRVEASGETNLVFSPAGDRSYRTAWTHTTPLRAKVQLVSTEANLVSVPKPIAVELQADRPPRVRLRHSGVRQRVSPVATIPLQSSAKDDFGIASLGLNVRLEHQTVARGVGNAANTNTISRYVPLHDDRTPPLQTSVDASHKLHASSFEPVPGDVMFVAAEAVDDAFTGAQSAHSPSLSFPIAPAEELFREILLRLQELRVRLRKAGEDVEEHYHALLKAIFPQDASGMLRNHRMAQRDVWRVYRALDESVEEMKLNQLGGNEALSIISRDVVKPLGQLHDLVMTRQRKALEALGRNEKEPVDELIARQKEVLETIKAILKSMAQWDSFVDVVNQLNTIIKIETQVKEQTESLIEEQVEEIFVE